MSGGHVNSGLWTPGHSPGHTCGDPLEMSPASYRMALSEAAAHVRYLERRQRVRVLRPEGPVRYELSVDPRAVTPRRPA